MLSWFNKISFISCSCLFFSVILYPFIYGFIINLECLDLTAVHSRSMNRISMNLRKLNVTFSNRKLLTVLSTNDDVVTMLRMSGELSQVSHIQWTIAMLGRRMCDWVLPQQRYLHRSVHERCCFFRK